MNHKENLVKRDWCFADHPSMFEIKCNRCGEHDSITWSEYQRHIWCYKCEDDILVSGSLLDGPVPVFAASIMGVSFDRIILSTEKVEKFDLKKGSWMSPDDYIFAKNAELI